MSCHSIGHGMNNVLETVIDMYDNNEISKDATLKIANELRVSVNYCDGNESEAIESILDCRCGFCLKEKEENENLYDLYDVSENVTNDRWSILRNFDKNYAHWNLYKDCFDEFINNFTNNEKAGEQERKLMDENR